MGNNKEYQPLTRRQKSFRMAVISNGLKEDISYIEIQQRLTTLPQNLGQAIGCESVLNVKKIISQFTNDVTETLPNGFKDVVKKHDLEFFDDELGIVGVQVKSSIYKILDFYKSFDNDYFQAKEILIQRKIIVLNGNLPDAAIQKFFLDQFNKIKQYHKSQS